MSKNLKFMLIKNPFNDEGLFIPRVVSQSGMSFEELLQDMEDNTAIRKQDLRLAITQFRDAIIRNLVRGNKIETPIGSFKPTVRGSFESPDESFNTGVSTTNHRVEVIINADNDLVDEFARNVTLERLQETSVKIPVILSAENTTKSKDNNMHYKDVLAIHGTFLKFDPEAEDEGIFWVDKDGEMVKSDSYSMNTKTNIHCQIPELAPGTYRIELASRGGNCKLQTASLVKPVKVS